MNAAIWSDGTEVFHGTGEATTPTPGDSAKICPSSRSYIAEVLSGYSVSGKFRLLVPASKRITSGW